MQVYIYEKLVELLLIYFFGAILVSFVCSIAESVILSISMASISTISIKHPNAGKKLKEQKENMDISVSSILILNTFAHTLGAIGVGAQSVIVFGDGAFAIVSGVMTLSILFISEIIPKTIGSIYYKEIAPVFSYIINGFIFITYPLLKPISMITGKFNIHQKHSLSKEELVHSTLLSEVDGVLNETESDVIENTLRLKDRRINSISTPRVMIFGLDQDTTVSDAIKNKSVFNFSRIPVYNGNIDDVTGFVLSKDIMRSKVEGRNERLGEIKYDLTRLNENIPISKALDIFIKKKEHMFLVEDSYGQTDGIISLEDCFEAILGIDIIDETDEFDSLRKQAKKIMRMKRKDKEQDKSL